MKGNFGLVCYMLLIHFSFFYLNVLLSRTRNLGPLGFAIMSRLHVFVGNGKNINNF